MACTQPANYCLDCQKRHPPRALLGSSPFHSIIAQERNPTPSETTAIRDSLRETHLEIARKECELADLRRRASYHHALIAPIQRVPPEILAEIFLTLTASEEEGNDRRKGYRKEFPCAPALVRPLLHRAPLLLCEISRKWRAIALSTPRLWNSISLKFGGPDQNSTCLCEMLLKRSGSLPLFIQLYPPSGWTIFPNFKDNMNTIVSAAARWRFLDLIDLPDASYDVLRGVLPNGMPTLETLSVRRGLVRPKDWGGLNIHAPQLRRLYFDAMHSANVTIHTFPWAQLTHIDVGGCSADDCLQILNQASRAVNCTFTIRKPSSAPPHPPIVLSELQTLTMHCEIDEIDTTLSAWWSCLTCTALTTLFVGTDTPYKGLAAFITRTGGTVENFTLLESSLPSDQFAVCLAGMPSLRNLTVVEESGVVQLTNQLWESLSLAPVVATDSTPLQTPLIPNLESLNLSGLRQCSHKPIVRMLRSRLQTADGKALAAPKLKAVRFSISRNMSDSAHYKLLGFSTLPGLTMHVDLRGYFLMESGSEASGVGGMESEEDDVLDSDSWLPW